jgi:hypothetical protein
MINPESPKSFPVFFYFTFLLIKRLGNKAGRSDIKPATGIWIDGKDKTRGTTLSQDE